MRSNDKVNRKITVAGDHRITKVGSILRKYKIDEIPQLLNVLIGDMSIVGPRPEVPQYLKFYLKNGDFIFSCRPGITDHASIRFKNENEILSSKSNPESYYVHEIIPAKINLNREFICNPSVRNYFKIIFLTLTNIFR